ncbi:MAG: NADH-quinone oxidoreductase subunit NuoF [Nitrospirota bacterium]|nr:NADH-quinone oxidoreductase subunit NuoF [Nitrospirota bacterium]
MDTYLADGGYKPLAKALEMQPQDVIAEVKTSGLRGRGGAGFPTHMKWGFSAADPNKPKYLLCNADEGEPGTFKDRPILEKDPHLLIEGMIISGYALGAEYGYVYLRGEYPAAFHILYKAINEAKEKGYLGDNILGKGVNFHLEVHSGAGAYICGEETALIESLEGKKGQPRIKPPFPVNVGAYAKPTVVNNVETLANVPRILEMGGEAWSKIGVENCPGPKIYTISGHVAKPGVYELPMGTTLREIIFEHAGGMRNGKKFKAVIPGGASTPMLVESQLDAKMDFNSMAAAGSMLGSGATMVMDEDTCIVKTCLILAKFFTHESCGKCTPCREGTNWLEMILERIEEGHGKEGDIELLLDIADNMRGKTFCPLGDGAISPVTSAIKHFRPEFEAHIKQQRCVVLK